MPTTYWKTIATSSLNALTPCLSVIRSILEGEYRRVRMKSVGDNLYSARLNRNARCLFMSVTTDHQQPLLVFMGFYPSHDNYEAMIQSIRSHSAQLPDWQTYHQISIENCPPAAAMKQEIDLDEIDNDQGIPVSCFLATDNKVILLSEEQQDALNNAHLNLPAIITGEAGSGKTTILLGLLEQLVQHERGQILYLAPTVHLAESSERGFKASYPQELHSRIKFIDFTTLMRNFFDEAVLKKSDDFQTFLQRQSIPIDRLAVEHLLQEARVVSGYSCLDDYLRLTGKKNSLLVDRVEKEWFWNLCIAYLNSLQPNEIDPLFCAHLIPKDRPPFCRVLLDEGHTFSAGQLVFIMHQICVPNGIVICMDYAQRIKDRRFNHQSFLAQTATFHTYELTRVFRCPLEVQVFTHCWQDVKIALNPNSPSKRHRKNKLPLVETQDVVVISEKPNDDVFLRLAQSHQFAIITQESQVQHYQTLYQTGNVFTADEIIGLEFQIIALINILDSGMLRQIDTQLANGHSNESRKHDDEADQFELEFNRLHVAASRVLISSNARLYIHQQGLNLKQTPCLYERLHAFMPRTTVKTREIVLPASDSTAMHEHIQNLRRLGLNTQANAMEQYQIASHRPAAPVPSSEVVSTPQSAPTNAMVNVDRQTIQPQETPPLVNVKLKENCRSLWTVAKLSEKNLAIMFKKFREMELNGIDDEKITQLVFLSGPSNGQYGVGEYPTIYNMLNGQNSFTILVNFLYSNPEHFQSFNRYFLIQHLNVLKENVWTKSVIDYHWAWTKQLLYAMFSQLEKMYPIDKFESTSTPVQQTLLYEFLTIILLEANEYSYDISTIFNQYLIDTRFLPYMKDYCKNDPFTTFTVGQQTIQYSRIYIVLRHVLAIFTSLPPSSRKLLFMHIRALSQIPSDHFFFFGTASECAFLFCYKNKLIAQQAEIFMPENINYESVFLIQQTINLSKSKPPFFYKNGSIFNALCMERDWTLLSMIWERLTAKSVNATIPKDLIVNAIDPLIYDTDGLDFFLHLIQTKVNYFYLIGHSPNFKLNVLRQMISEFSVKQHGYRKNKLDEVIDIIIKTYDFYAKNEENSCLFLDLMNDIESDIVLIQLFESKSFRLNFIKNMQAQFDGKSIIDLTIEFASSSQKDADSVTGVRKFLLYTLLISPLEAINDNSKPDTLTPDLAELYVKICCDPSNIPALFSPQQFFRSKVPASIIHEWFMRGEHITDFMASCFQLLFSHSEAQAFKENLDQYITSIFSTNSTIPPMFLSPEFSENSALRKMLMTLPNFAKYMQESPTSKDQTSVSTRYNMFPIKDAPAPPEKDLTPTPFNRFH